jgi:hypothetical protein
MHKAPPQGLFGVGFCRLGTKEARHGAGKMKCDKHFGLPENHHVSPSWTVPMERRRRQAVVAFEQADGGLFGPVEPRHDRRPVVLLDRRRLGLGADLEPEVLHPARTAPRSVPRSAGQGRRQTLRTGPRRLLGAVVALGDRGMARQATRVGPGCDHPRTTLYRVGDKRPLSRLRGPRGLENREGRRKARLGTRMENAAEPFPSGRAGRLERHRTDGPRVVRQVAV